MAVDVLEQGREAFRSRAWGDAYERLAAADARSPLTATDLDRLARAAYLTGRDPECEDAWARAHQSCIDAGETEQAARCAFWLGLVLLLRGEEARGGGWMSRANRLVAEAGAECVEQGYLLTAAGLGRLHAGEGPEALALFGQALAVAERYGEPDLRALCQLGTGQALIASGEVARAVALLDEAMVAVETGEVSTVVAGIVYCAMIIACGQLLDLRRAQQWTIALSHWCDAQPDLVPYRGQCLVHRSQLAQLRGDWSAAAAEADRACARLSDPPGQAALGMAFYQRAELHRLSGRFAAAEDAYAEATRCGHSPHPGLALLRLAQGRLEDAVGAIRRVAEEVRTPGDRATVLAGCVEIMLAAGDVATARAAADELSDLARAVDVPLLEALSAQATGAVLLTEDDGRGAVAALRRARTAWERLHAPYQTARVQVLLAAACRRLGDADTARIEEDAAREVFASLGAQPDLAHLDGPAARPTTRGRAGLTAREVEVIRLVAAGLTNREIAARLVISEKTVARHLNNVFTRLDLPNRAAATAYAYEHQLV